MRKPGPSLQRLTLAALLLGSTALIVKCRTPGNTAALKDQGEAAQPNSLKASKDWWQDTRSTAAAAVGETSKMAGTSGQFVSAVNAYNAVAQAGADDVRAQRRADLTVQFRATVAQYDASVDALAVLLGKVSASLKLYKTSQKTATTGAQDASETRYIPQQKPVPADANVCQLDPFRAAGPQNWGVGGPGGAAGVIELTDAAYEFVRGDLTRRLEDMRRLAVDDTTVADSAAAQSVTGLTLALGVASTCAQDIKRRIDSWWDFDQNDFDRCDPFAAGTVVTDYRNPSCRWWPHSGYLKMMPNGQRPCQGSFPAVGPGFDEATAPPEFQAYFTKCREDHQRLRSALQSSFNDFKRWGSSFDWNGVPQGGTQFIEAAERVGVAPANLNVTITPPGGEFSCDMPHLTLKVPVNLVESQDLESQLKPVCGLTDRVRPAAPTCVISPSASSVPLGGSVNLTFHIGGIAATATWWDGAPAQEGQVRATQITLPSQTFAGSVTGAPWRAEPAQATTCSVGVGGDLPPVCPLLLSHNTITRGQSTTLMVGSTGGPITAATYNVQPGGQATPIAIGQPAQVSPAVTSTITVQCTGPGGIATTSQVLTVDEPPPPPPPPPQFFWCAGGPVMPYDVFGSQAEAVACGQQMRRVDFRNQPVNCEVWVHVGKCDPRLFLKAQNMNRNDPNSYTNALTGPGGNPLGCKCLNNDQDIQIMHVQAARKRGPDWLPGQESRNF